MAWDYEFGDQVEARLIVGWTPGETDLVGRCILTWYRGDEVVDSTVGSKVYLASAHELAEQVDGFRSMIAAKYRRDLFNPAIEAQWLRRGGGEPDVRIVGLEP